MRFRSFPFRLPEDLGPVSPAAILSPMDGAAVEMQLRDYFASKPDGLVAAYLFGSFGRGTAGSGSDVVDVAVPTAGSPTFMCSMG